MPRLFSRADNVAKSRQAHATLTEKDCAVQLRATKPAPALTL
jgi:hypothetical protein